MWPSLIHSLAYEYAGHSPKSLTPLKSQIFFERVQLNCQKLLQTYLILLMVSGLSARRTFIFTNLPAVLLCQKFSRGGLRYGWTQLSTCMPLVEPNWNQILIMSNELIKAGKAISDGLKLPLFSQKMTINHNHSKIQKKSFGTWENFLSWKFLQFYIIFKRADRS